MVPKVRPRRRELPSGSKDLGLKLIGKTINAPEFGDLGRIADVSAKGYLTMFYEPQCGRGGVQIVDISNPASPVKRGYIPSHVDTFSGEGSQVVTMDTPSFKGDLLVYQNEWCPQTTNGVGGVSLVDVSNPDRPKKLVEGAGDFTKKSGDASNGVPQTKANQTHSAFACKSQGNGRWYVVLVDDMETLDIDILDTGRPSRAARTQARSSPLCRPVTRSRSTPRRRSSARPNSSAWGATTSRAPPPPRSP